MANRWNIPEWLEQEVRQRDRNCIYCGISFHAGLEDCKNQPTWEHIVNDASIITAKNIALCCFSCNASKGAKELSAWLESKYCKSKGITRDSVSKVVKQVLENPPELT